MVTSRVISPLIRVMTRVTLLITPLKTTHEPPSRLVQNRGLNSQNRVPLHGSSKRVPLQGSITGFYDIAA